MKKNFIGLGLLIVTVLGIAITICATSMASNEIDKAANVCPVINSVSVYLDGRAASGSPIIVSVGNHVQIRVCVTNKAKCAATLTVTLPTGGSYTRTIAAGSTKCEDFYFQINSKMTSSKCAQISVTAPCINCGQRWSGNVCFRTR